MTSVMKVRKTKQYLQLTEELNESLYIKHKIHFKKNNQYLRMSILFINIVVCFYLFIKTINKSNSFLRP